MRRGLGAALAAGVVVIGLLVAGCSGDGGGGRAGTGEYALTLTGADVHAVGPPPAGFPGVQDAVMETLNAYLTRAVVEPLRTGRAPSDAEELFTAAAGARLAGPDRAALVEDGSSGSGRVRQDRAAAKLSALTGPGGEVVVVTAQLDIGLLVTSGPTRLAVARAGEMVLVPDGGAWKIDSYDLRTQRDSPPPPGVPG